MKATDFASKNFGLILIISVVVGLALPNKFDFLLPHLQLFLMAMLFFVFVKIDLKEIASKIRKPLQIAYILLVMMLALPLAVFLAARELNQGLLAGFMLLATMAPAASAIAYVDLFKGDVNLGIVVEVIYYLIFPFFLPIALLFSVGADIAIDVPGVFASTATMIFAPLLLSQLLLAASRKTAEKIGSWSNATTLLFLVLIALGGVSGKANYILQDIGFIALLFAEVVALMAFLQIATYYAMFFLPKKEKRTISVCKTFMNGTLSLVLATNFFPAQAFAVILAMFVISFAYPFAAKQLFKAMNAEAE